MNSITILLVDDDTDLLQLLAEYFEAEGYAVLCADNADQARVMLSSEASISLMILDIMMPGTTGLDFLKETRGRSDLPIIMLTGRGDEIDRIIGLELGADDYLSKPCNPRELNARIKSVLRRTQPHTRKSDEILLGPLRLNGTTLQAYLNERPLPLTSTEFRTLFLLAENAGQAISKEVLTQQILNRKLTHYDRSMDVHISRIRQKLLPQSQKSRPSPTILALRGVGYQLVYEE